MSITIQDIQGLVFNEYINIDNALKILKNWDDILSKLPTERRNRILEKKKEFDPVISLKKICKNKSTVNNVNYLPSKNLKNMGRLFAQSVSLQNLPREFRNAISGNYHDIDMVNCHPSILLQYCKKNDIKCDNLEYYVNNRDEVINKIMNDYQLNKEDVKQLFLSVMNGGKREGITDLFFTKFKMECERIHTFITSLNQKLYKEVYKRKDFNINGSLTNIILCDIENKILLYAVQFLMNNNFKVDVLVFDGCMIRKEEGKEITDELLDKINKYVLEKTEYDIKFVEKKMEITIDLSIYEKCKNEMEDTITYYKDKEEFEKTHLKIVHPPIYLSKIKDKFELQSRDNLLQSYQDMKTIVKMEVGEKELICKTSFIKTWINDENIRKYESIVFTPSPIKHDLKDYNTWQGFDNEKKDLPNNFNMETNEYIIRFKEYISNLVNNRENYINYIIAWVANIIQYPAYRSQVCIILYSLEEGVGKTKFIELIENIIGEKYSFSITDISNQLFGKHSMAEYEKLFISLSEIKGKDTYYNSETFKSRITDPKRDFEPKGLKSFNSINYCNYICSTNNINSVNAGDNDRRFCVITCNNKKINDKIYFMKFDNEVVKNPEANKCIYEYLKHFPIETYVPNRLFQQYRPTDDALYEDLKEYNKDIEWNFLENFVKNNKSNDIIKIEYKNLWYDFENFLERVGEKNKIEVYKAKKFYLNFKQKICHIINKKENYEDTIQYSTKEKRITQNGFDCFILNIKKLKTYFNLDVLFIEEEDNEEEKIKTLFTRF